MKNHDEILLDNAVQAMQNDGPSAELLSNSAQHVAERLGIESANASFVEVINSCDDVQKMLPAYQAKNLSASQSLLVESHLRDCHVCLHKSRSVSKAAVLDWS